MTSIELNNLRWRNYHKLDFRLEESLNYFQSDTLMIDESLRLRILECLTSMCELRNELYRCIYKDTEINLKPIQIKMF